MELIGEDSTVSEEALQEIYKGHREGIRELAATMASPPYPVLDPARLSNARSFAGDLLALLEIPPAPDDRDALRRRVNLTYEAILLLIDCLKATTAAPKVPAGRSKASAGGPPSSGSPAR